HRLFLRQLVGNHDRHARHRRLHLRERLISSPVCQIRAHWWPIPRTLGRSRRLTAQILTLESVTHFTDRLTSPHLAKGSTMAVSTTPRRSLSPDSVEALRRRI